LYVHHPLLAGHACLATALQPDHQPARPPRWWAPTWQALAGNWSLIGQCSGQRRGMGQLHLGRRPPSTTFRPGRNRPALALIEQPLRPGPRPGGPRSRWNPEFLSRDEVQACGGWVQRISFGIQDAYPQVQAGRQPDVCRVDSCAGDACDAGGRPSRGAELIWICGLPLQTPERLPPPRSPSGGTASRNRVSLSAFRLPTRAGCHCSARSPPMICPASESGADGCRRLRAFTSGWLHRHRHGPFCPAGDRPGSGGRPRTLHRNFSGLHHGR